MSFSKPKKDNYVDQLGADIRLTFPKGNIYYRIEFPKGFPEELEGGYLAPLLRAMRNWERALKETRKFVPAGEGRDDDLLIVFVTDLPTAGVASQRAGERYRPQLAINITSNTELPKAALMETVALHELGHTLGLWGHSTYEGDTMYPIAVRREPSDRDIKTLQLIYGLAEEK